MEDERRSQVEQSEVDLQDAETRSANKTIRLPKRSEFGRERCELTGPSSFLDAVLAFGRKGCPGLSGSGSEAVCRVFCVLPNVAPREERPQPVHL